MFRSLFNKVASFQLPRLCKIRLWQLFSYEFSEKQVRKCHLFKLLKKMSVSLKRKEIDSLIATKQISDLKNLFVA